ncbi:Mechanosensitive ion channel protein [Citrus sinensis]|nr:Mechanosensitive ion channel protein [Citrus sinensis]
MAVPLSASTYNSLLGNSSSSSSLAQMEGKKDKGNDNAVIQINTDTEESHLREQAKNLNLALKKLQNHVIWDLELWKWCLLALVTLSGPLRSKETSKIFHHITRTLASFVAGPAVWFVKTLSVKLISVSFQSKRFFHRIHQSIFHQHVVQVLSAPQKDKVKKLRNANIAMQFISRINKEKKAKRITTMEKISACILQGLISCSGLKSSMFIGEQKLKAFLDDEQHVKKMLKLFRAIKVYDDRKTLKCSLNDAKTAIEELNRILSGIVVVVIIIVWLLVMGLLTYKVIAVITSQLLLLAFMFGNTARTCFEAIIFVFVTHPFDVGDRCFIDGVQMVVDEMNILTTIFLRYDNEKIYYPNSVLGTKPISNFYRSPREMSDPVEFAIDVFTSVEVIENLKSRIIDGDHNVVDYMKKIKRRSKLVLELKKIFEDLGIKYNLLPQEVCVSYAGL